MIPPPNPRRAPRKPEPRATISAITTNRGVIAQKMVFYNLSSEPILTPKEAKIQPIEKMD